MKCQSCGNEMFIRGTEVDGNRETFIYKCPNPGCASYGYERLKEAAPPGAQTE